MKKESGLKSEWPKIKKQLLNASQEALALAKKGEEQLAKVAHQGILQVDKAALSVKKEQLYYLIGKEYVRSSGAARPSSALQKLLKQLEDITKEEKSLQKRIKKAGSGKS